MNRQRAMAFGAIVGLAILIVIGVSAARTLQLASGPPLELSILYSTEKEGWLSDLAPQFEATRPQVDGRPIQLKLKKMGSREMYLAVLNGAEKPDLISPASSLQASILEDLSTGKFGRPIVRASDPNVCRPTLSTPLVLVAWQERADVLWGGPDRASSDLWKRLHNAVSDPRGWEALGRPEWGYVKFGHTDPLRSNSGLQTILLITYDYFGKTSGLTSADILSDPGYQKWFLEIEQSISQFGDSTGNYMKDIVAYGPSMYDLVAVYESVAIEQAANAAGRYGELRVYYPPATLMSDHPFCVLSTDWVSPEKARAAQVFVDFLLSRPAQELALNKHGYRPVDPSIALDQAGGPFTRYAANGLRVDLPQQVETPPGSVLNTLLEFWSRNAQK